MKNILRRIKAGIWRTKMYPNFASLFGVSKAVRTIFFPSGNTVLRADKLNIELRVRNGTSDVDVVDEIFFQGAYDLPKGWNPKVVIDAGANIGCFAAYIKSIYPEASVYCIEPEDSNYKLLTKNMELYKNVHLLKAGIWGKNESLCFENLEDDDKWAFQLKKNIQKGKMVRGVTLDKLMAEYGLIEVDLMKIDIEGAEEEVFTSKNSKFWLPKTKHLIVELHRDLVEKDFYKYFFDLLSMNGFGVDDVKDEVVFASRRLK